MRIDQINKINAPACFLSMLARNYLPL